MEEERKVHGRLHETCTKERTTASELWEVLHKLRG